ncbi:unnamed protein product [Lactuca virosa]|uniref:Uncharacterized protein n=1 Tax=Lactuca virosa TaxID=75947 RepID=A0AAU9MRG4_9ASTR|nr:unnamed protein product [Lactuca virosa]
MGVAEYHIMLGTDHRIATDPLSMRMREDQIKQIWSGDSVYPTVNYIEDPHQNGNITSKDEIDKTLASEKVEKVKFVMMKVRVNLLTLMKMRMARSAPDLCKSKTSIKIRILERNFTSKLIFGPKTPSFIISVCCGGQRNKKDKFEG